MTIAMVYREVGTCGGIQRGASFQVDQFRGWGYDPVVLTEKDLGHDAGRMDRLAAILRERQIDHVIEHDAYSEEKLSADISASRSAEVPIVVFWHSVFSWMIAQANSRVLKIFPLLKQADALITLSKTDEAFFRLLGCRAFAIPYCDADLMGGFERREYPHRILWMGGRFNDWKRPCDAVRVLAGVREKIPDAELLLLGDGNPKERSVLENCLGKYPAIRQAVRCLGFQKDVRPYLEMAGVGLVTSKFEGFCHSVIEMKMASLPVVSYAMPYLPTLEPNTGAIVVPQCDVTAAAHAIAELWGSPDECRRQGDRARQSYEALRAFDERLAYERLFAAVEDPASNYGREPVSEEWAASAVATLLEHCVAGWSVAERRGASSVRKELAFRLGRALLLPVRLLRKLSVRR